MKDYLIWHYLTKRSDNIQVGDYYCFSETGDTDTIFSLKNNITYHYLVKLPVSEVVLMRLKGLKKDFIFKAVRKSQHKLYNHYRVQGKYIPNLSYIDLRRD